jgi:hypothetical protein
MSGTQLSLEDLKLLSDNVGALWLRAGSPRFPPEDRAVYKAKAEELEEDMYVMSRALFEQSDAGFTAAKADYEKTQKALAEALRRLVRAAEIATVAGHAAAAVDGLLKLAVGLAGKA